MKFLVILSLFPIFCFGTEKAPYIVHQMEKGETISEILHSKNYKPLYGDNGWSQRTLEINRINGIDATKLEIGEMLIIPHKHQKETVVDAIVSLEDKLQITAAAPLRSGVFGSQSFNKYNFTFLANAQRKERKINNKVINSSDSYGYEAGLGLERVKSKRLGDIEFYPAFGIIVGSQRAFEIEAEKYSFAEFNTDAEVYSTIFFRTNNIMWGPTLKISDNSELDFKNNGYIVRRDRNIWLGTTAKRTFNDHYAIQASANYTVYSKNLNELENDSILKLSLKASINLLDGFHLGVFARNELIDRKHTTTGLELSYLLN